MRWGFWSSSSDGDPADQNSKESKQQQQQSIHSPPSFSVDDSQSTRNPSGIRTWLSSKKDWNSIVNSTDWVQFTEARNVIPIALITSGILFSVHIHRKYLRRIPEANDISSSFIRRRSIFGRVTSVGDGDNFRIYHTPGGRLAGWEWLRKIPTSKKELKQQTIHVRLAGIDAPELSHFGRPAQPFAKEAHTWLTNFLLNRRVRAYILSRDQYQRVIATVYVRRWWFFRQDVGLQMLRKGLATVYEAKTGAEFGGEKMEQKYRAAEALAKKKGKGMWKGFKMKKNLAAWESPREYKSRMKGLEKGPGIK
ncbi:hypothetical protein VTO42DRAFT_6723 [Malbranchea cinnamomea]